MAKKQQNLVFFLLQLSKSGYNYFDSKVIRITGTKL